MYTELSAWPSEPDMSAKRIGQYTYMHKALIIMSLNIYDRLEKVDNKIFLKGSEL